MSSNSPSSSMDQSIDYYPLIPSEIRDYYEKVSEGLIEERPYDSWGPESENQKAYWDQWSLPIRGSFDPVDWNSGFTGRGIAKHKKKAMERPGHVGPMGEKLVMEVDPVSENIVYRVISATSSGSGVGKRVKHRRRSSLDVASKMYKRLKKHFFAFELKSSPPEAEPIVASVDSFVKGGSCMSQRNWTGESMETDVMGRDVDSRLPSACC